MSFLRYLSVLSLTASVAACGADDPTPLPGKAKNRPPVIESASIATGDYTLESTLKVLVETSDPDGDALSTSYRWMVNGTTVDGKAGDSLAGAFKRGDKVSVEVTADDGTEQVKTTTAAVTIGNALPVVEGATIAADDYRSISTVSVVPGAYSDADGDDVTLLYQWYVDGLPVPGKTATSADGFSKHDKVYVQVIPFDGTAEGLPAASNEITINNTPPSITGANLTGAPFRANSTIGVALVGWIDADGDEADALVEWEVNGVAANTGPTLVHAGLKRGDKVKAKVFPHDGESSGEPVFTETATLENSEPVFTSAPALPLTPVYAGSSLELGSYEVEDADGDSLTYDFTWYRNGTAVANPTGSLYSGTKVRGDEIKVMVGVTDDIATTENYSNTITVENSAPVMDAPWFTGTAKKTGNLIANYNAGSDPDGDSVTHTFTWYVDDLKVDGVTAFMLDPSHFEKDQTVRVEARPYDGIVYGATKTAETTVTNTAPVMISVTLTPTDAYKNTVLTATHSATDADGELLTYEYTWFKNGAVISGQTAKTLSGQFEKGDEIAVEVTPDDGDAVGSALRSSAKVIQNTAPVVNSVTLNEGPYYRTTNFTASADTDDIDGDGIGLGYQWYINGAPIDGTPDGKVVRGDTVKCSVTASDGSLTHTLDSATVTIVNSPPPAPVIDFGARPVTDGADIVNLAPKVTDVDGDGVQYQYDLFRNGEYVMTRASWDNIYISTTDLRAGDTWRVEAFARDNYDVWDASETVTGEVTVELPGLIALDAGYHHACAIAHDGAVFCWGKNMYGSVGDGSISDRAHPTPVQGLGAGSGVVQLSTQGDHTCALLDDGTVKCWGYNDAAQIGVGEGMSYYTTPQPVAGLSGVVSLAAGYKHVCALTDDGEVYCWGSNTYKQLGNTAAADPQTTPIAVQTSDADTSPLTGVKAIASGLYHTCAVMETDTMKCWGRNSSGQVGWGASSPQATPHDVPNIDNAIGAAAGTDFTCALGQDGSIQCWGKNDVGQIGDGTMPTLAELRKFVSSAPFTPIMNFVEVSATNQHACGRTEEGVLYCWGLNSYAQAGDPSLGNQSLAISPPGLGHAGAVSSVSTGGFFTCAITGAGGLKCWGHNTFGQTATGVDSSPAVHPQVPMASTVFPDRAMVSAGSTHSCAVGRTGDLKCWGRNANYELGTGNTDQLTSPTPSHYDKWVKSVAVGHEFTCALLDNGAVDCWGNNTSYKTGAGSGASSQNPVRVIASGAVQVTAGEHHACALVKNGGDMTVECWGDNSKGQWGRGTTVGASSTPQAPLLDDGTTALSSVASIDAGKNHTCALMTDSGIYCWGDDTAGQTGNHILDPTYAGPVMLFEDFNFYYLTGMMQANAGGDHACGLKADGTTYCWGLGDSGQLGDGAGTSKTRVDTPVAGNFRLVVTGGAHTCGIDFNDKVWCWGDNGSKQTTSSSLDFDLEPFETSQSSLNLSLGADHTLSIGIDGIPRAWGANANGQAGVGHTVNPLTVPTILPDYGSGL